ncbi:histidinol-phosphatase HisJ family protein [[Eubacterium] hominis]|uniref:histidinol-phosphatase HisJ family protein n=1 Tax=[Eubacterium] hominis TaxID=2764325 RepID=UPI003A4D6310
MFSDYHMHTSFSDDSIYPMEELVNRAIYLGLDEICFTEHVDHGIKFYNELFYTTYRQEFDRCRKLYGNRINLKYGIEFGMQTHTIAQYERDFKHNDFDFVILSCHQVNDLEFWTQDFQKGKTQREYNLAYYQEILDVMKQYKNYSVLGHLDAIKRDDKAGIYPFSETKDILTKILKLVIQDGKGLEINTSNERYGLHDLTPCRDILRLYKDLGGKILTFGSDIHKQEHVGYHIQEIKEDVKALGFETFCTYEKMCPIYHDL